MRRLPLVLSLAGLVAASTTEGAERPLAARTLEIDGIARSYYLHMPPALPAAPAPLVLVFHGGGGNGPGTERLTRFTPLADREGFLVAFPEGLGKNWNDGREFTSSLRPEQPVSVLMLQGTRDPLVPYHGGAVAFGRGRIIDTEEAARRWAALDGGRDPVREPLPAGPGTDRCGGLRTVYPGGRDGSEVTLVRLDGGGHTWPGGGQYLPEMLVGRVCRDFDATALIWDFFKAHPKRGGL